MQPVVVIGSSQSARRGYDYARQRWADAPVVTCNRGLSIERDPDYYFLSDTLACQTWAADGHATSKRNGKTKLATLRRDLQAMKFRRVEDFDLLVREGHPFEPFQVSGLWCVEFAIRFLCANPVILCGMDGYSPTLGLADYFEGAHKFPDVIPDAGKRTTERVIEPLSVRLACKYFDVRFIQIGAPCYQVNKPNWEVVSL